ncbi:hypothetical protein [Thalassobius vesicularis]|uniref:hypothetical protein n=1 Tax=Thalassobius vesicularis TaxID=1294297 RepID=UPI001B3B2183|nr:hypothetical protein [Thalassobius vesicularis]
MDGEARDSWRSPSNRRSVLQARIQAYKLRKRLKKEVRKARGRNAKNGVLGRNRYADKLARGLIVKAKRSKRYDVPLNEIQTRALVSRYKRSTFLSGLLAEREQTWVPIHERLRTRKQAEVFVKGFCFLSNPKNTMSALKAIARAEAECLSARIHFLDDRCLDIGAWLTLAAMRGEMASVFTGGRISNSMSKVLTAVRLNRKLGFALSPQYGDEQDVWAFPYRSRRPAGTSTSETMHLDPQSKEEVGGDLCEAINQWLDACVGQQLSRTGMRFVKTIVGESLDNAERHSQRDHVNDGDWLISGFMAKREGTNGPLFRCQLAFLSVGASIAETVQDAAPEVISGMETYVQRHVGSFANHDCAEDHLRTIYALQDKVTRDQNALAEGRGGTGFRDIICLFGDLAGGEMSSSDAKIGIISGRTCLHIGYGHTEVSRPLKGQEFNIWLNEQNDATKPPDQGAVIELDDRFCGTLITLGFTFDPDYLERTVDVDN